MNRTQSSTATLEDRQTFNDLVAQVNTAFKNPNGQTFISALSEPIPHVWMHCRTDLGFSKPAIDPAIQDYTMDPNNPIYLALMDTQLTTGLYPSGRFVIERDRVSEAGSGEQRAQALLSKITQTLEKKKFLFSNQHWPADEAMSAFVTLMESQSWSRIAYYENNAGPIFMIPLKNSAIVARMGMRSLDF